MHERSAFPKSRPLSPHGLAALAAALTLLAAPGLATAQQEAAQQVAARQAAQPAPPPRGATPMARPPMPPGPRFPYMMPPDSPPMRSLHDALALDERQEALWQAAVAEARARLGPPPRPAGPGPDAGSADGGVYGVAQSSAADGLRRLAARQDVEIEQRLAAMRAVRERWIAFDDALRPEQRAFARGALMAAGPMPPPHGHPPGPWRGPQPHGTTAGGATHDGPPRAPAGPAATPPGADGPR